MINKILSHYKIIEEIGRGGMGVVYKAQDTKLDRLVALKFLPPNLTTSHEEISRFEQEAKAISSLNHPNIETIHDVDEVGGQKFIVLEYIPGGTLKSKLRQLKSEDKSFSLDEVLDYGIQMAEGLAHAHKHGIVHRDVKTENIMLTEEGKVKLTDFGLAKLRGTVHKTKTGSTLGTAAYMSPEQVRGEEADPRSDIFSLGVVLYELATSRLPFQGDYEAAMSYSILNENPQPARSLRPDIPRKLETVIGRCLEKDSTQRYQHAEKIINDLRALRHEKSPDAATDAKRSRMPWLAAAVFLLLFGFGAYFLYFRPASVTAGRKSIAVLPFKNLSDSKEDEYFADGITEDIITQLSKIADMKVISRTSVMQYKGVNKNIREIGRELDVGALLEGSVRRYGNQVRIVAQLIDAKEEGHLWADTYNESMTQIFVIQSDVAQRIAAALKAKLLPEEKERIEKKQTENMEAYQLYLKGRYYWNKRIADDLNKAIDYFTRAIKEDSTYALAYAGLAQTYAILPEYAGLPTKEWMPKAEDRAKKALELDPSLAEAHAVLGLIRNQFNWDSPSAEKEYSKAIELNTNYATAYHWYGMYLRDLGRFDEAMHYIKKAQELDPLSLVINVNVGLVYYHMRRYDEAIVEINKSLEMDQSFALAHWYLGLAYCLKNNHSKAILELEKVRAIVGIGLYGLPQLGYVYARAGKVREAKSVIDELLNAAKRGYATSFGIALVYNGLGDRYNALNWLEKAFEERDRWLEVLKVDPTFDNLRSEARFKAILDKIGFKP